MKLNDVKFTPATNAVADVYTKATGMPIVGEMMVAAAGQGGEPTPTKAEAPTYTYSQETTYCSNYDVTLYGDLTVNLATTTPNATIYYKSSITSIPVSAEDFNWDIYSDWIISSSRTFNIGGAFDGNALMIAYAAADGMENSDYTYITLPYNTTQARTCDEIPTIYDLNIEFTGVGQATVSASARVDYSADEIYYRIGGVDIRLKPMEGDYTQLELDNDYTNRFEDITSTTLYGTIEVFSPEQGENIATFELEATVTPMFDVFDISVQEYDVDDYSINGSGDFVPREMFDGGCIAEFQGCQNQISLYIGDGSFDGTYSGVADFQDGGSVTVTDINNNISWSGTYRYNSLP